jgi:hypothetical protein
MQQMTRLTRSVACAKVLIMQAQLRVLGASCWSVTGTCCLPMQYGLPSRYANLHVACTDPPFPLQMSSVASGSM